MKDNLKNFYLVFFLSAFFMQAQQCMSVKHNLDVDYSKSLKRIAIAAVGDSVTSEISMRAGRAPYYLFFSNDGVFIKSIENPVRMQGSGASSGVVELLKKESVETVIAGNFGDKMKKLLKTNKINYHEHTGIAKEIAKKITNNKRSKNAHK
jgi:predicted Fe-Mo cluster-binding NifX family protein